MASFVSNVVEPNSCELCEYTLNSFLVLCENKENLFRFFYNHRVLSENKVCVNCNTYMSYDAKNCTFRCRKTVYVAINKQAKKATRCSYKLSQTKGTFFGEHKISIIKISKFVAYWALLPHPRSHFLEEELDISSATVVDWSSYLRETCFDFIEKNSTKLGGFGKTVEIDEAKVGKRKYNRGRIIKGNWIFGAIERDSKKTFIIPVQNRSKETLLPIIKDHILPGTTIISDCWKAYECLETEGFKHLAVNHSINFVDPVTGANTQQIERLWRDVRSGTPRYGNKTHHLHGHIAEFLFKRTFPSHKQRIHHLWLAISELYKP